MIEKESILYKDILQGYFRDTFKTITYKVLLGMKFVKIHCPKVQRIYVVDDDAVVLPWNLYAYMKDLKPEFRHYGGYVFEGYTPIRHPGSRYYVSENDYSCKTYPPFPSGTMYFLSYDAMVTMYSMAHNYWVFYLDDVFFSIMAEVGNIRVTRFGGIGLGCGMLLTPSQQHTVVACHGAEFVHHQLTIWTEGCHHPVRSETVRRINNVYCLKTFLLNKR